MRVQESGRDGAPALSSIVMRPRDPRVLSVHLAGLLASCHCIVALAVAPCSPVPRPVQFAHAEFPPWHSREPLNVKVTVEFLINTDGTIGDPKIISVDPEYFAKVVGKSALAAAFHHSKDSRSVDPEAKYTRLMIKEVLSSHDAV